MEKVLMEVTHLVTEKHAAIEMDPENHEALRKFNCITQLVTLKPVGRNKSAESTAFVFSPIQVAVPGNEVSIGDRFTLELLPVR